MNDNDSLRSLFEAYEPQLTSDEAFMQRLQIKLARIEYVRQMQQSQLRRYRRAAVASSVVGAVLGGALATLYCTMPSDGLFLGSVHPSSHTLKFIVNNGSVIALALTSVVVLSCIFAVFKYSYKRG